VATARGERAEPRQRFWLRSREPLPDDQLVHSCAATYASDMLLLSTSVAQHGTMFGAPGLQFASLDHAVWFHRPARLDDWVLMDLVPRSVAAGRGWYTGTLHTAAGVLAASFVQETLFRPGPNPFRPGSRPAGDPAS
jgi:acyl-CoA thioesterase-2